MAPTGNGAPLDALRVFADELKAGYDSLVAAQEEEALKGPTGRLLSAFGSVFGLEVLPRFEAPVRGVGRPDIALDVGGLLCGYVELKAPSVPVRNLRGRDREQLQKFMSLPNLLYTNGNEWVLYQDGERKRAVRLSGDVVEEGADAVGERDAERLSALLRDLLGWKPIVPKTPRALAEALAPLCRLLRGDVLEALENPDSAISYLARDWREFLFPEADDARFADAYAQTLTYALLLAEMESGEDDLDTAGAAETLRGDHGLLSQALTLLADPQARTELSTGVGMLERTVSAVEPEELARGESDPWLYFYEDFLAAYDRRLRGDAGVYYTPVEVVKAQVNLVSDLLVDKLGKEDSFADRGVTVLDPATGTGTYPLAVLDHGLAVAEEAFGPGMRASKAGEMARNMHAFESLVGPYAVAHLKLSKKILDEGGSLPDDDLHVYLTDTLESPHAVPRQPPLVARKLGEEHRRALAVKRDTRVLVCIGNPPYDREQRRADDPDGPRKGGWVRFGEGGDGADGTPGGSLSRRASSDALLEDFLRPARESGSGIHLTSMYNDYVYFWRWALWKVFEQGAGPGIVSFITASSYLRGPGFVGMREAMRRTFDELWILDLGGDNLGARPTENVFNIQTPVAIATGIRYGEAKPEEPARVRHAKIEGTRAEKLARLALVGGLGSLDWGPCMGGWQEPFLPEGEGDYFAWPPLTDVFPWHHTGVQMYRTWPIGETRELLERRWRALLDAPDRAAALKESRDRKAGKRYGDLEDPSRRLEPLADLPEDAPAPGIVPFLSRSFDRKWILKDARLGDYMRPELWRAHGPEQAYLVSLLTDVMGGGPAAVGSAAVPDCHSFRGRGGRDVIPLWRDAAATRPNVAGGLLEALSGEYGEPVVPEDLFAYAYAVLGSPAYTGSFSEELSVPGPRLPITKDAGLFRRAADLGRRMLGLHTYGERFGGSVPRGGARLEKAIPEAPEDYPEGHDYDPETATLFVGGGEIRPVPPEVYGYEVSGLEVVKSWLGYRRKNPRGRTSSPLDGIRPERWTGEMTRELLQLLWVLEATVEAEPELAALLEEIVASEVFAADELPEPTDEEREPPTAGPRAPQRSLLDASGA